MATKSSIPQSPSALLTAIIKSIRDQLIPKTKDLVATGSSPFGAAVLTQSSLETVTATVNSYRESPLLHGETNCIREFFQTPAAQRPDASTCIFFSTHEPCSLCLSGIAWTGFPILVFLFTYEYTRDSVAIPEDIEILHEVFRVQAPMDTEETLAARPLYNKKNKFFSAQSVAELLAEVEDEEERGRLGLEIQKIKEVYDQFSRDWTASDMQNPWRHHYQGYVAEPRERLA
jgi:tRNA(Arg) A34 adenosine deaminase TadA